MRVFSDEIISAQSAYKSIGELDSIENRWIRSGGLFGGLQPSTHLVLEPIYAGARTKAFRLRAYLPLDSEWPTTGL